MQLPFSQSHGKKQHFFHSNHHLFISLRLSSYHFFYSFSLSLSRFALDSSPSSIFLSLSAVCWLLPNIPNRTRTHVHLKKKAEAKYHSDRVRKAEKPVGEISHYRRIYTNETSAINVTLQKAAKKSISIRNSLKWRKRDREKKIGKKEE